ncbi:hypothetical protein FPQ18DRAFT_307211 [Pyronema domesticum]|nr:hypothetical protein FPQ18DRAFT_307211 [Pyronema domesticum]
MCPMTPIPTSPWSTSLIRIHQNTGIQPANRQSTNQSRVSSAPRPDLSRNNSALLSDGYIQTRLLLLSPTGVVALGKQGEDWQASSQYAKRQKSARFTILRKHQSPRSQDFEIEEELHEYLYQRGMDPASWQPKYQLCKTGHTLLRRITLNGP